MLKNDINNPVKILLVMHLHLNTRTDKSQHQPPLKLYHLPHATSSKRTLSLHLLQQLFHKSSLNPFYLILHFLLTVLLSLLFHSFSKPYPKIVSHIPPSFARRQIKLILVSCSISSDFTISYHPYIFPAPPAPLFIFFPNQLKPILKTSLSCSLWVFLHVLSCLPLNSVSPCEN